MPDLTESHRRIKRLVVLSDGTWQSPQNKIPTNILKLTMAILHESPGDNIQQVLFYDSGIGTAGHLDKITGGGLGEGIDVNIQELYTFLAINYDPGDEIYMFGFSRGSYTVRSLSGLINESGLVRRTEIQYVHKAYQLYRDNNDIESEEAVAFREAHGDRVPIKLLACFDTVGSLGLPFKVSGPLSGFDASRYAFHNTQLSYNVENAVHAMSIDEDRKIFAPTYMTPNDERGPEQLTQLFFAGGHGGVGGGDQHEWPLSDFALNWMIGELKRRNIDLAFDATRIPRGTVDVEPKEKKPSRMFRLIEGVTGKFVRQIMSVEECHPSVAERYRKHPNWRPASLEPISDKLLAMVPGESDTASAP